MKELSKYIRQDGNLMWIVRIIFYLVSFGGFMWVYIDSSMDSAIRILIPALFSITAGTLKYDSITEVNEWGEKQKVVEGLLLFPVSKTMILKNHYLELLKTQGGYMILLLITHLCARRTFEMIEFVWIILVFAIPALVLLIRENKLIFRIDR